MEVQDAKHDPSQQAVYWRRPLCQLRPVPWASKMNFPLRTRRGHDTALSSPLLEHLGILKHRGSSDVCVWLNCTGLLDGLTIHKQHYKSKASCPSYWLQKTPKGGFQSSITCIPPRRMLLRTRVLPTFQALSLMWNDWKNQLADPSHGANLRCGGTLKYWMEWT